MDLQLLVVSILLGITVGLIVTEVLRIDVVAILAIIPFPEPERPPQQARSGGSADCPRALP
ncbi:MAG: hypothetical protein ABEL51_06365 [Salinibacter sp.]